MNPDNEKQIKVLGEQINKCMDEIKTEVDSLKNTMYGNKETKEKGVKEKVDEMHEILIQFRGIPKVLGVIVLIGAAILTLKGWFVK